MPSSVRGRLKSIISARRSASFSNSAVISSAMIGSSEGGLGGGGGVLFAGIDFGAPSVSVGGEAELAFLVFFSFLGCSASALAAEAGFCTIVQVRLLWPG